MNILITGGSGFVGLSLRAHYMCAGQRVFVPTHTELDILNLQQTQEYIDKHEIDTVIHTACINARHYARNKVEDVYTNLLMFENMVLASKYCTNFITFGAGAEFDIDKNMQPLPEGDIDKVVPLEHGGFLKRMMSLRMRHIEKPKCYNLRFFGGFGPLEANDRFIKGNLISMMNGGPITIHQNRLFDFIYVQDLALLTYDIVCGKDIPHDLNCVYKTKYTLMNIAQTMINITGINASIIVEQEDMGLGYIGDGTLLDSLGLELHGLETGIQYTYESLL